MCPPTTPDRTSAKHRSSAVPFTVTDTIVVTNNATTKKAFIVTEESRSFIYDMKNDKLTNGTTNSRHTFSSMTRKGKSQRVALTISSMIAILMICSTLSYGIGCYVRYSRHLNSSMSIELSTSDHHLITTTGASIPTIVDVIDDDTENAVPTPWTLESQSNAANPQYSFQNFVDTQLETTVVSSNSVLIHPDGTLSYVEQKQPVKRNSTLHQSEIDTADNEQENAMFEPSGQHILVDIENVDRDFLRSEERLTRAMKELIQVRTNMTLLSYHCHSTIHQLSSGGISCAGILLESHVSFHTFPMFGTIAFDLFSCGEASLLSILSDIRELFAITPTIDDHNYGEFHIMEESVPHRNSTTGKTTQIFISEPKQPHIKWIFKRRGFRGNYEVSSSVSKFQSVADELPDLHWILTMGNLDKTHVTTVHTDFQRIDIYDVQKFHTRPSNEVDRVVFLDGIIQSRFIGEHAYHEALVHPVMFCHDAPKRVIIIGGGEGATLREVLKHNTVEEVIMVEIDEIMVETSRTYLPEWSTCENGYSCFDDPRATVYYTDAIAWFIHRFGENSTLRDDDVFDIIIMDALDPDSVLEFSDFLYKNRDLMQAFSNALGDSGIFVAQVGEVENMDDLPASFNPDNQLSAFLDGLESFGFESIVEYSEAQARFIESWGFVVAMKDRESRSNWLRNEAEINYEIVHRVNPETPLVFFDGATMMNYQFASRVTQEIWCRDNKVDDECSTGQGFDPYMMTLPQSVFNVQPSTVNKGGRGVFATQFVPKGTVIGLEECVNGMFLPSTTFNLLRDIAQKLDDDEHDDAVSDFWDVVFFGYIDGYGWIDSVYGLPAGGVDPGIMTFVNHGCNSTYNVGTPLDVNEMTAMLGVGPGDAYDDVNVVHNPYDDRRFPLWECEKFVALRDIQKGEELFDNYLVFGGGNNIDDWDKNLFELKSVCMGKAGTIAEYEAAVVVAKNETD